MLLIPKAHYLNSSRKRQTERRESRKNSEMAYGEIKNWHGVSPKCFYNGCLAGTVLNLFKAWKTLNDYLLDGE